MTNLSEPKDFADAVSQIAELKQRIESLETDLSHEEDACARSERALSRAESALEDSEAQLQAVNEELASIHSGIGLRSIIERSYAADPVATENDLLSVGLGHEICFLKVDHECGRLPLFEGVKQ